MIGLESVEYFEGSSVSTRKHSLRTKICLSIKDYLVRGGVMCEVEYHISLGAKPHISISLKARPISTWGRGPHQFMISISRVWHYEGGAHTSSGSVSAGYGIMRAGPTPVQISFCRIWHSRVQAHIGSVLVYAGYGILGAGPTSVHISICQV